MTEHYPRDLAGYGAQTPHPKWPGQARVALQFVINFEEGGENCILHGDAASEAFLSEIIGAKAYQGVRHPSMESIYEYGARAGVWRLMRTFDERQLPVTVFCVGMALERNPEPVLQMKKAGHEIASHGYRWIDYQFVDPEVERRHIEQAIAAHERILGERPVGFYQGRTSPQSRQLCIDAGFTYDADSYADDLPYWDLEHSNLIWWCPTHWIPMTCASRPLRDSIQAPNSTTI